MEVFENIRPWLEQNKLELAFNSRELRHIPQDRCVVLVINKVLPGLDALLLNELLRQLNRPYILLESPPSEDFPRQEISMGLIVDFPNTPLKKMRRNRQLNKLFGQLRKKNLPIIPLRLHIPELEKYPQAMRAFQFHRAQRKPIQAQLRIGQAILPEEQKKLGKNSHFRLYVQSRLFALGTALQVQSFFFPTSQSKREENQMLPLAPGTDPALIAREMQSLTFGDLIASQGKYDIFVAKAQQIPNALLEIGRLRELTFRKVGEGTGKERDIDEYDLYYYQLIIWDREAQRIVGGYRMGPGDEIFTKYGVQGFYIHSLFRIKPGFYPFLRQSVELGRSYVVPDYQRQRLPLFLLWKGILYFLLRNPQYKSLYGPVSISKYYTNISKNLIVAYIRKFYFDHELAQYLEPRRPFRFQTSREVDLDLLLENLKADTQSLDNLIQDIEPQHFRLPVLIRQYIKLNARFISFNVDPNFSDVLDGFLMLDLKDVPLNMLEALQKDQPK